MEHSELYINAFRTMSPKERKAHKEMAKKEGVMKMLANLKNKSASAISCLGFCLRQGNQIERGPVTFTGEMHGELKYPAKLNASHDSLTWNDLFHPVEDKKGRAVKDIPDEELEQMHQGTKAIDKFNDYLWDKVYDHVGQQNVIRMWNEQRKDDEAELVPHTREGLDATGKKVAEPEPETPAATTGDNPVLEGEDRFYDWPTEEEKKAFLEREKQEDKEAEEAEKKKDKQ